MQQAIPNRRKRPRALTSMRQQLALLGSLAGELIALSSLVLGLAAGLGALSVLLH